LKFRYDFQASRASNCQSGSKIVGGYQALLVLAKLVAPKKSITREKGEEETNSLLTILNLK
jgi:hypothetical protein